MTTNAEDDLKNRELSFGKGFTDTQGVAPGFADPSGQFPDFNFIGRSSLPEGSRGVSSPQLAYSVSIDDAPVGFNNTYPSQYPYVSSKVTEAGHVIELNDTPGGERVLIKHSSGAGVEFKPDGSVAIISNKNRVEYTPGNSEVTVEGEATLNYKGNLTLNVTGDFNINCLNYNVNTRGNKNETVRGGSRERVYGDRASTVSGNRSVTTAKTLTQTQLSDYNLITKGDQKITSGGGMEIVSSGAMTQTSETEYNNSSPNTNIVSDSLSVFGATGTIGGEGIMVYGKNFFGVSATYTGGVEAPTFHGDLTGTASTTGTVTATAVDTDETAQPTSSLVTSFLESGRGIRDIQIDVDDFVLKAITTPPRTEGDARALLRDPAYREDSEFIAENAGSGNIGENYSSTTPPAIGRARSSGRECTRGSNPIGTGPGTYSAGGHRQPKTQSVALPEPQYNSNSFRIIGSATKVSEGIPLSRFLGGEGQSGNLSPDVDIDTRRQLCRNYYLHSMFLKSVRSRPGRGRNPFANHRLIVVEGYYKKGTDVNDNNIQTEGILDLRSQGRAVVYKLVNSAGRVDYDKTFELATMWKNTMPFESLILDYDKISPTNKLECHIIVTIPNLDEDYKATFQNKVFTEYNNSKLGNGLIEVNEEGDVEAPFGNYEGQNGRLDINDLTNIGGRHYLRSDAAAAYLNMVNAANAEGIEWTITDSYRTYEEQVRLANTLGLYSEGGLAATPGRSNHGWGLAVDLGGGAQTNGTPENNWLRANAGRFGFSTIAREPWHWQFNG